MRTLLFRFLPDVPLERQATIIDEIKAWDAVITAGQLYPDETNNLDMRRRYYAYTDDRTDLEALEKRVATLPEIEEVFVPSERGLGSMGFNTPFGDIS